MPSTVIYGKTYTTVYLSLSLILQVFLTGAVIHRLLRHKAKTQAILGQTCVKHYNILSVIFAESALMNVICSLCLLFSSILPSSDSESKSSTCFQTFLAITPAFQVRLSLSLAALFSFTEYFQACSNYLIIYRGAKGYQGSWTETISFGSNQNSILFQRQTQLVIDNEMFIAEGTHVQSIT